MKERITITLDDDLIRELDSRVDEINIQNRSHAISVLLRKAIGNNVPKTAVILSGGKGTRFRPITLEIPKALMPIQGKTMTEHIFDLLHKFGIRNSIISVGYLKDKIMDHYGNGKKFGMNISYVEEDEPLGTAGPLKLMKDKLTDTFVVTNGDELKDLDLSEMYRIHKANKALVTIALWTVDDPSAYGVVELDGNRIKRFVEKPKKEEAPSNLINSGLYIIEPEVLDLIPDGPAMFEYDVFPKVAEKGKLFGYPFSGQWFDTGNPERYERAIKNWKGVQIN